MTAVKQAPSSFCDKDPPIVTASPTVIVLLCLVSYLTGSLPFGLWVGWAWKGVDIRALGSKNTGATNAWRVLGPWPAILIFLLDVCKGMVGILLARFLLGEMAIGRLFPLLVGIGLCAVIGHTLSPFLRFNGGKGVATTLGVMFALSWPVAVIGFGTWFVVVGITRYVSFSSLAAGIGLIVGSYLTLSGPAQMWMVGLCTLILVLVTIKHRANIRRLLDGTEAKIGQRPPVPVTMGEEEGTP